MKIPSQQADKTVYFIIFPLPITFNDQPVPKCVFDPLFFRIFSLGVQAGELIWFLNSQLQSLTVCGWFNFLHIYEHIRGDCMAALPPSECECLLTLNPNQEILFRKKICYFGLLPYPHLTFNQNLKTHVQTVKNIRKVLKISSNLSSKSSCSIINACQDFILPDSLGSSLSVYN